MSFVDIDECTDNTDMCADNANCTNSAGSYSCDCNAGYSGDGFTCFGMLTLIADIRETGYLSLRL